MSVRLWGGHLGAYQRRKVREASRPRRPTTTEEVGFQMINPATEEFITEFGPLASAGAVLLDEINRMPLKSQSAFLERLQDRTR